MIPTTTIAARPLKPAVRSRTTASRDRPFGLVEISLRARAQPRCGQGAKSSLGPAAGGRLRPRLTPRGGAAAGDGQGLGVQPVARGKARVGLHASAGAEVVVGAEDVAGTARGVASAEARIRPQAIVGREGVMGQPEVVALRRRWLLLGRCRGGKGCDGEAPSSCRGRTCSFTRWLTSSSTVCCCLTALTITLKLSHDDAGALTTLAVMRSWLATSRATWARTASRSSLGASTRCSSSAAMCAAICSEPDRKPARMDASARSTSSSTGFGCSPISLSCADRA